MIVITGGAGFIGSNFILKWLENSKENILNIDNLSYAANLRNLEVIESDPRYSFIKTDIQNQNEITEIIKELKPRAILNFAAESHVDRSIEGPESFINTNILGTYSLLEASLNYWNELDESDKKIFRFFHISTDEVFGSLNLNEKKSTENSSYKPNSPYSASKAASDHLVRAWHHTFKLPTLVSNCTNNYGPHQHEEKLIPLVITKALKNENLPIYGDGKNIRDWLYVEDHCEAIMKILENGKPGETYNIGGNCEKSNLEVVDEICKILDFKNPKQNGSSYSEQIKFVKDRPGHDFRYSLDIAKIENNLNWKPKESFASGLAKTVQWYLDRS
ncbi:MAG: dTDP-glucose 4,6-dehydratase [Gammaproteobacteria bacterium]|nr:MAG: dTDP-glucose 4,6-dehydratase [Gammaproteobacteria bacterium]